MRSAAAVLLLLGASWLAPVVAASSNPRTGRVFVFSGADGSLLKTIQAPQPGRDKRFGHAVASLGDIDGDAVPDLAVGAPRARVDGKRHAGKVYLISGADGSVLRTVPNPFPARRARFGFSLAAVGDLDLDGAADLAVGAPRALRPGRGRTGEVFLLGGADGSILARVRLRRGHVKSLFGWSVAAGPPAAGSGPVEILVGAPNEEVGSEPAQGRAYLFDPNGTLLHRFDNPKKIRTANFGRSVAFLEDDDQDGLSEILIGADTQDVVTGDFAGGVYLYRDPDPSLVRPLFRHTPKVETNANYGWAIAPLPDLDGDGFADFAASAPDQTTVDELAGIVLVQSGSPDLTDPRNYTLARLRDPEPHRRAFFGGALANAGDLTEDGLPEIIVGAELHENDRGVTTGRAYIFEAADGSLVRILESPTGDRCGRFGWSVAGTEDLNADGIPDLIVGAPFDHLSPRTRAGDCLEEES